MPFKNAAWRLAGEFGCRVFTGLKGGYLGNLWGFSMASGNDSSSGYSFDEDVLDSAGVAALDSSIDRVPIDMVWSQIANIERMTRCARMQEAAAAIKYRASSSISTYCVK